jgi:hypothetical protein
MYGIVKNKIITLNTKYELLYATLVLLSKFIILNLNIKKHAICSEFGIRK